MGSAEMRLQTVIGLLGVLMVLGGCAMFGQGAGEALQTGGRVLTDFGGALPPPWNWIVVTAGTVISGAGSEITRRSLKNSPEGKLFGPVRKPAAPPTRPDVDPPERPTPPSDDLAIGVGE